MWELKIGEVDLAILAAYLLGVVLLGLWIGRSQRDISSYLLAGRDLPWWVVLGSIVATETSTVTFLSVPGLAMAMKDGVVDFTGGNLCFLQLTIGYIIGRILVVVLLLPHYFRGQLYCAYEVLDRRFGGMTKQSASLLFIVTRTLADGLRLYLTAIVLDRVVGIDLAASVVVIGIATIAYTFVGGMKSVVWNDCIQFVVYIAGALLAGWVILDKLPGGWAQVSQFAAAHDKFQILDLSFDLTKNYTLWAGVVGGTFLSLSTHGTDQLMVQRYLCARNQRGASRALILSGFVVCAQFVLFLLLGVGLACFYSQFPPEVAFEKTDEVLATFIVGHLPVGVVGITLAAVFSAAMSTLSSSLNSSATAVINDFYLPFRRRRNVEDSSRGLLRVSRLLTVVFGVLQICVGIAGAGMSQNVVGSVLAIAGFTTGIVLGVFFLGVLTKSVSQRAALTGLAGGLTITSYVTFGTDLAWPWFTLVGSSATFVIGVAAQFNLRLHPLRPE